MDTMDTESQRHAGDRRSQAQGAAPALVFLHGSGNSAQVWDEVIARLPGYACVALALPGHGALVDRPGPAGMTLDDYVAGVRAELTRRGLRRVCLVGHSLGSALALRLAVDYPDLVARLVLVGAGARLRVLPAFLAEARERPDAVRRHLAEIGFARANAGLREAYLARPIPLAPGMLHRDLAACDTFDMLAQLGHVAQPVLIVAGEEDQLTPPKYALYLRDHLADARLLLIPSAGHYLPIEAPAALADAIRLWLDA
jgi:pimeloyl-ACP methyl ester carboxylesterase